jgi:hypothetical protein
MAAQSPTTVRSLRHIPKLVLHYASFSCRDDLVPNADLGSPDRYVFGHECGRANGVASKHDVRPKACTPERNALCMQTPRFARKATEAAKQRTTNRT